MAVTTQIEKLPKWAREHITSLNRRIQSLETRIKELLPEEPTRIVSDSYGDHPIYLPEHDKIRFYMTTPNGNSWIDIRLEDDHVRVMSDSVLAISPQSGNVVNMTSLRGKEVR